jgi:hypothetical protein
MGGVGRIPVSFDIFFKVEFHRPVMKKISTEEMQGIKEN